MNVVAYCRFSSDNQRSESIDAQVRAIKEYCIKNNYNLINIYKDEALTGTSDDRPAFLSMIEDSAEKLFQFVIVHKLDRFARNRYDSAFYKRQLKNNGVRVLSVLEYLDDTPENVILESVLEGMAEYYSKNLSREVKKGKKENILKGLYDGGSPPLGYDVNKETQRFIINEHEATAVRLIFERFSAGIGYGSIAEELNNKGYKTKKYNRPFTKYSFNDLLKNRKYIGEYYSMGITVKDVIPPIIDNETFERVQAVMKTRLKGGNNRKVEYLLSGKVFCACGSPYVGNGRTRDKGKDYYYYVCAGKKVKNCNSNFIEKSFIEKQVIDVVKKRVFDKRLIKSVVTEYYSFYQKAIKENSMLISNIKNRIKLTDDKISKTLDLLCDAELNKDAIKKKLTELENEKQGLKYNLQSIANNKALNPEQLEEVIHSYLKVLNSDNIKEKKGIINLFIDKVIVDKEDIHINYYTLSGESKSPFVLGAR